MKVKILIFLALVMLVTDAQAQRRRNTRGRNTRTTKVVKQEAPAVAVPLDSLVGKVYSGKIGQTVVSFFGNHNTYGDVTQELYVWHDNTAVIRQINGTEENYIVSPYEYTDNTLKVGEFTYKPTANGADLQLQTMKQKDEKREGKLSADKQNDFLATIYKRGKYVNGWTEQTDEDKQMARTYLTIAAEANVEDAKAYLTDYYKKLAEKGNVDAVKYMLAAEKEAKNYSGAHGYVDQLLDMEPENISYLEEKASLYDAAGKKSQANRLRKKINKLKK